MPIATKDSGIIH